MGLNPIGNPDWPKQTADLLESVTTKIREGATTKVVTVVRAAVFGLLAAILVVIVAVLALICATRALQLLIGIFTDHERSVWIAYLAIGALFCTLGALLMSKRHAPSGG